jgi:dTDP-4-dehydrorhamnose reductase
MLVHVSTDFVFDGNQRLPYHEESRTAPLQVYGQSKLEGEFEALRWERSVVVRTSWVFGPGAPSFVATIVRLLTRAEPVRVVDDQVGCPTYAPFLARALIALAERGARGVVHYRNEGPVSWHGFAVEIGRRVAPGREIAACSTAEFLRPARRPAYSVLDVERYEAIVGAPVEPWRRGLDECLNTVAGPAARPTPPGARR